ncbi:MAG: hydantoinase/oxoprolinase family protein, partial [Mesorhizobium sp.]|nr:hydantoinase/oxoprolinase family protein [Mesorhizobium sp.]
MIRLATDVGGTFTDLIAYDERSGRLFLAKSLTTTDDQSVGVLDAIAQSEEHGLSTENVSFLVHGGTTVINAITERKGVRTALITTEGFRDVLEIGRGNRPDLYNLRSSSPEPFVPRHLRLEVAERLDARGNVIRELDENDVLRCIDVLKAEKVEAVGIVFLHSYVNPAHESRCAALVREALPEVSVCTSSEISRQWREYERSNTVAMNAFVQPIIRRYFRNLEVAFEKKKLQGPYYAMQSNGGIAKFEKVVDAPLTLVESGPSGGVAGAARIGSIVGEPNVLYFDVGGTTAKCSLILDSQPKLDSDYKLEKTRTSPGYTVQVPVVDIV